MDNLTRSMHVKIDCSHANSVVTPIYQCSAFHADSPFFYTRKNNPNIEEWETAVKILEDARFGIAFTTGMAAISSVIDLLSPNNHLVINHLIYGCSYKYFQAIAKKRNIHLSIINFENDRELNELIHPVHLVLFETPTNPFLRTISIEKVSHQIRKRSSDAIIVVDNTWATPLFQHPLSYRADISIHSATKYLSGHSDVMGGIALTNSEQLESELRSNRFYSGTILDPHSAWLLSRSIKTLGIRMKEHIYVTQLLTNFLSSHPKIEKVYFPNIDGIQLLNYGGIIFFSFDKKYTGSYKKFSDSLKIFSTGTGMAAVTSMVAQPYTGSHASLTDMEKKQMGIDQDLVRLCFGFENPDDLITDLSIALDGI